MTLCAGHFLESVFGVDGQPVNNDVTYCFYFMIFDGDNFTEVFKD